MAYKALKLSTEGAVTTLCLDEPASHNALDWALLMEIRNAVIEASSRPHTRAMIIKSSGRAFSIGAHLPSLAELNPQIAREFALAGHMAVQAIEAAPFATIAAVNGLAIGGGWEIALACDLIYASEGAIFSFPEVDLGLFPAFGGTWRLTDLVGPMRARELVFTGMRIGAKRAKELNLVLDVLPSADLEAHCLAIATKIASKPGAGVDHAKRTIARQVRGFQPDPDDLDGGSFARCDFDFAALERRR